MKDKKESDWKKELARDFIALGGIPFLILVLARIWIIDNLPYLSQFVFSALIFILLVWVFKANIYSGLGLIMLFFTALHYADQKYTILGSLVYLGLIVSLFYLKYNKKKIITGVLAGAISIGLGYWIIKLIFL